MKKLLTILLLWVVISMFGATSALAFSLGGYVGDITIGMEQMYNWGRMYNYVDPTPLLPLNYDGSYTSANTNPYPPYAATEPVVPWTYNEFIGGNAGTIPGVVEDSWGIARVDHIKNDDGSITLWESSTASAELTVFFWGFQDDMLVQNVGGDTAIFEVGGHVQFWEDTNKDFSNNGVAGRSGVSTYPGVTDGTLVMDYNGAAVRNYTDKNGNVFPYVAEVDFDFSSTTGGGNMLLDIVGGTQKIYFDTNTRQGGSDLKIDFSGDVYTGQLGWVVHDGPTGYTNVVPEPCTMLLLGSGLLGLAAFGRKKVIKKS